MLQTPFVLTKGWWRLNTSMGRSSSVPRSRSCRSTPPSTVTGNTAKLARKLKRVNDIPALPVSLPAAGPVCTLERAIAPTVNGRTEIEFIFRDCTVGRLAFLFVSVIQHLKYVYITHRVISVHKPNHIRPTEVSQVCQA